MSSEFAFFANMMMMVMMITANMMMMLMTMRIKITIIMITKMMTVRIKITTSKSFVIAGGKTCRCSLGIRSQHRRLFVIIVNMIHFTSLY